MLINLADDSKNLFFKINPIYPQQRYKLTLKSVYSNRWLLNQSGNDFFGKNAPNPTEYPTTPNGIVLTLVSTGDTWASFSWDKDNVDGEGTPITSYELNDDIEGYYIATLNASNYTVLGTIFSDYGNTYPITNVLCKVINNWDETTPVIDEYKPVPRGVENNEEYIYYRE